MTKEEKYLKLFNEITGFIELWGVYNVEFSRFTYKTKTFRSYNLYFTIHGYQGPCSLVIEDENDFWYVFTPLDNTYDELVKLFSRPELFRILKAIAYNKLCARLVRYIKENGRHDQIQCGEYIFTYEPYKYAECVQIEDTTQSDICGKYFPTEIDGHGTQFDEIMEILNKPKMLHLLREIN